MCCVLLIDPFPGKGLSARSLAEFVELLSLEQTTDGCVCLFFLPHTLNITSHITGLDKKNCSCLDPCVCVNSGSHANAHTTTHITRKRWPTYFLFGCFLSVVSSKSRSDCFWVPLWALHNICRALLFRESESPSVISLCVNDVVFFLKQGRDIFWNSRCSTVDVGSVAIGTHLTIFTGEMHERFSRRNEFFSLSCVCAFLV